MPRLVKKEATHSAFAEDNFVVASPHVSLPTKAYMLNNNGDEDIVHPHDPPLFMSHVEEEITSLPPIFFTDEGRRSLINGHSLLCALFSDPDISPHIVITGPSVVNAAQGGRDGHYQRTRLGVDEELAIAVCKPDIYSKVKAIFLASYETFNVPKQDEEPMPVRDVVTSRRRVIASRSQVESGETSARLGNDGFLLPFFFEHQTRQLTKL